MELRKFQQTDSNDKPSTISIKSLYNYQLGWAGNKVIQACIMMLKVIIALPDNNQTQRIEWILLNKEKELNAGLGVPTLFTNSLSYRFFLFYHLSDIM